MLALEPRLRDIVAQEYPRFSDAEYARRHKALGAVMEKAGVDHLIVITDTRAGNAPQWVTGWPGTVEAYVIFKPGEKPWMAVEWVNHFPLARKIARGVEVHWGAHHGLRQMVNELKRRGAKRVGVMGPLRVARFRLDADLRRLMPAVMAEFARRLDESRAIPTMRGDLQLGWAGGR